MLAAALLGALPDTAVGQQETVKTWREVLDGSLLVPVTNESSDSESWTATISPLTPVTTAPPELVVEPAKKDVVASQETVTYHVSSTKARPLPSADLRYLLTVERKRGNEVPTFWRAVFHVRPALLLPPQSDTSRYVLSASRSFPFVAKWNIETPLVLAEPPSEQWLTNAIGKPLGVVATSSSTGLEQSAVISWQRVSGTEALPASIPLDLEFSRWSSAKMTGTLTFPDGQTRNVVVQTADLLVYPLLVICGGVLIAFAVKTYVTRQRGALLLRASLADTDARLRFADVQLQRDLAGAGVKGFDILGAWSRFRADNDANLEMIVLTGAALDASNAPFLALNTAVDEARRLPARWVHLGVTLQQLDNLRDGIATIPAPGAQQVRPAIQPALDAMLGGAILNTIDELAKKQGDADVLLDSTRAWRATWDQSARLLAMAGGLPAAVREAEGAQTRLWLGFDATALSDARRSLDAAIKAIVDGGGRVPAARESAAPAAAQPAAPDVSTTLEARQIQRQDRVAVIVALTLGVLTGLNAEYFGKPFGSLADYARVLAWALSASIAADVGSLALSRVKSMLSVPARDVTRA